MCLKSIRWPSTGVFKWLIRYLCTLWVTLSNQPSPSSLQVWPPDRSGGLCRVSDTFPANGGWVEVATAIWEGPKTSGGAKWRRSLHDAVQSPWETQPAHDHHDFHGQLQRQRPDVNTGETDIQIGRYASISTGVTHLTVLFPFSNSTSWSRPQFL